MTSWRQRFRRPAEPAREPDQADAWHKHAETLAAAGIPEPGVSRRGQYATLHDEQKLYDVAPSFADMLPWAEYLPRSQSLLLDDGASVAAFFELTPIGTEGRERHWLSEEVALTNMLEKALLLQRTLLAGKK
ncbi:TraC family protein [Serratia nevei]|uniref:TraC family protein n=1 Tax=Serratia TaxID=613 RepID=UPI0018D9AD8B|nr:TraC family protein [Serratia marcescens]MBI6126328.1 TraC family protein [Serratia marcescens]MBN5185106.1 TraC family protein [Serratia marcescens]MBN5194914.1 TraC family protein [Serratia marcescens]MBN5301065.1 TraC family protein [Serratia marcescens]